MSNLPHGDVHVITPLTDSTVALSGQRLSCIRYKGTAAKVDASGVIVKPAVPALPSRACSVPVISDVAIRGNLDRLMPHVVAMIYKVQDDIIRERIAGKAVHVTNAEISVESCCNWLEEVENGGRMTKVGLQSWFDATLVESLTVRLADKMGISDTPTAAEVSKVDALVAEYKDKISALAGGKTSYSPKLAKSLIAAVELVPSDDDIGVKLTAKLVKMRDAVEVSLFDALS